MNINKNISPLVSIIVTTYNSSKFVVETLESTKKQTYRNVELIITDDCSGDNTVEICKDWLKKNRKKFVRTEFITVSENTGIPANCNRGIKIANGEWIISVAGDDALMPNCIENYIKLIQKNNYIKILHSNVAHYKETFEENNKLPNFDSKKLKINQPELTAKEQFEILLRKNKIWASSLFINRIVFNKVGLYDETTRLWEDRPMLLKITNNNIKLYYIDFISCKYRHNSKSVQIKKNNNKILSDFTLDKSKYYFNNYLKYLPPFERFTKRMLLKRILLFESLGLNKNYLVIKAIYKITAFPWYIIANNINKKYL